MSFHLGQIHSGEVVELFATITNTDLNEGRGSKVDRSYHQSRADAVIAAEGIGVMGSDGTVERRLALKLGENQYILLPDRCITTACVSKEKDKIREQALGKLTEAEKAALLGEDA